MEGNKEVNINKWIYIVAGVLASAVGIIYVTPKFEVAEGSFDFLPALNATINGTVSILLVVAVLMIKQGNRKAHQTLMTTNLVLSALFLVSYVLYHTTHESTAFGGEGMIRNVYFFILLTHIVLAIVIVPLVLISFSRALSNKFDKHKKIARITFPIWLYVSVTGVIVYFMISPYY
jgi:putative membrane protein